MAFAFVIGTGAGSSGGVTVTTSNIDTTGCDILFAVVTNYVASAAPTVTDSKSNTWTALTSREATDTRCRLFYCTNPTVGTGHNFSGGATGTDYPAICVAGFSGADTVNPFEQENGNTSNSATALQTGNITPDSNGQVLIAACAFNSINTLSVNEGFTISNQVNFSTGNCFGVALAYLIQPTAQIQNPQFSWSTSCQGAAALAAFEPASAPPAGKSIVRRRRRHSLLAR